MECSSKYLPSNAAPILQYDRGPSFDFLAKILGADTPLVVTQYPYILRQLRYHSSVYSLKWLQAACFELYNHQDFFWISSLSQNITTRNLFCSCLFMH